MDQIIVKTPIGKIAVDYQNDFVIEVQQVADQVRAKSNKDPFAVEIQNTIYGLFFG